MKETILYKLANTLNKKYKYIRENPFIHIEIYNGIFVLNWTPRNDLYINYDKINKITLFINRFLEDHKQEGFFYVGGNNYKIELKEVLKE